MSEPEPQPGGNPAVVVAIDPGRDKCGIAVVRRDLTRISMQVMAIQRLAAALQDVCRNYKIEVLLIGNRTGSKNASEIAKNALPGVEIRLIDEHLTSEQARKRYFSENPPRGLRRLIPRAFLLPPVPYDDYVALILAERHLARTDPD